MFFELPTFCSKIPSVLPCFVFFSRTQMMNTVTQETKQNVVQTTLPVRSRLQRPRPNVQKARQRQIVEKGEVEGIAKNEGPELQKDETKICPTVVRELMCN